MDFGNEAVEITELHEGLLDYKDVKLSMLRLDKIHPVVSGNKLFKLQFYLQQAIASSHKTIITFGGAYSNHLVAAAFACKQNGLKSIGIVRGEEPVLYSHTLLKCREYGMKLHFISREDYKNKPFFTEQLTQQFGEAVIIPEGGYGAAGMQGAEKICDYIPAGTTHVCLATGTGTTFAGIATAKNKFKIIGIPVLKGFREAAENIKSLTGFFDAEKMILLHDYHFGGYAKKTDMLIAFMNKLWQQHQIPTDFVYTGKMMFAVYDLLTKNYFPPQSNVLCIHTGGLQGNRSLPVETLMY